MSSHTGDGEKKDETAPIPTCPAELTLAFLQRLVASASSGGDALKSRQVVGFTWKPLEVGVISEVVGVDIDFKQDGGGDQAQETSPPSSSSMQLIAKFLRPEFPFENMFVVESKFYQTIATQGDAQAPFPFSLPTALFLSKSLIIMERVEPVATFSCVEGCPTDRILAIVTKLAQMHGRHWHTDCSQLAASAGIGSELTREAKRDQFPSCWQSFLEDVPLEDDVRSRVKEVCEQLSGSPKLLTDIHDAVGSGPSTLIHGDFHTANLLFSVSSSQPSEPMWLVDWATCGTGNPMRDLAFFFIVGVRPEDRSLHEAASLQLYSDTITQEGVTHVDVDAWKRHYRVCVLNQFVTLAVYDNLSKHLASNAKTEKLKQELHAHFREVNTRACLAVLDNFDASKLANPSAL